MAEYHRQSERTDDSLADVDSSTHQLPDSHSPGSLNITVTQSTLKPTQRTAAPLRLQNSHSNSDVKESQLNKTQLTTAELRREMTSHINQRKRRRDDDSALQSLTKRLRDVMNKPSSDSAQPGSD